VLYAARCKYRMQKIVKNLPTGHHRTILLGCVFASKAHINNRKKLLKLQYLLHLSPQYGELGPLVAEIGPLVWGTPGNFNGFGVLAALVQRHHSTEADQTLHGVWPSPGWYTTYTFSGVLVLLRNFARCKIHFASCKSCALVFW